MKTNGQCSNERSDKHATRAYWTACKASGIRAVMLRVLVHESRRAYRTSQSSAQPSNSRYA